MSVVWPLSPSTNRMTRHLSFFIHYPSTYHQALLPRSGTMFSVTSSKRKLSSTFAHPAFHPLTRLCSHPRTEVIHQLNSIYIHPRCSGLYKHPLARDLLFFSLFLFSRGGAPVALAELGVAMAGYGGAWRDEADAKGGQDLASLILCRLVFFFAFFSV